MLLYPHECKGKLHKYDSKALAFRFVIQNKTLMKKNDSDRKIYLKFADLNNDSNSFWFMFKSFKRKTWNMMLKYDINKSD